ncbi:bile acid:sodium symporter family protein [Thiocystis minor]|uniref:bile acid:sodium symporter family protein n=1 Tax=Thiocystis minor TaxID=61597 RepID=UPI0030B8A599
MCYLARGDVALSISLTAASTLLAVVLTPWLTWIDAGAWVTVPVLEMLRSIALVVLLPVIAGVAVNRFAGRWLGRVQSWAACLGAGDPGHHRHRRCAQCRASGHGRSGAGGGGDAAQWAWTDAGRLGRAGVRTGSGGARTLAIKVGMQNSGLAATLALKSFPVAALPGALFSVWHNLSGAMLAAWWSRRAVMSAMPRAHAD